MLRECFEQYDALLSSENPDDEEESNVKWEFLALIRQPVKFAKILPKVDWLKLLPILVLCGGESQKPGNFKERTTYTLPYFHKKRYNLRDSIFVDYSNKI